MNKKVKDFWNKNKKTILAVVGAGTVFAAGVAITACIKKKSQMNNTPMFKIDVIPQTDENRKVLESYGATYKEGYDVPFATREVVEKFLDERGSTYQIDMFDDLTSVVYISK